MFWVDRMSLFIGIFILHILSRIGSWRFYNLSLLYCIPLILIGIGLIKWCGSLQRMDLWKLKSYCRALMTRGGHAFPWKKYLEGESSFRSGYFYLDKLGERFSLWIIWGGIFTLSIDVACTRIVGNQLVTCSFAALMHIICGCFCLASLGFLEWCPSKWWID